MATTIEISHQAVSAELARLINQVEHVGQVLAPIGEDIVERAKQRFATSTSPDGARWKSNAQATLMHYIQSKGGFSKKTGKLLGKGRTLAANKKPLQGLTGSLARQIFYSASDEQLTVGSSMIYAAMQHFGGTKSQFPHLWGDIPARQFLPITAAGELHPAEADKIIEQLRRYLQG